MAEATAPTNSVAVEEGSLVEDTRAQRIEKQPADHIPLYVYRIRESLKSFLTHHGSYTAYDFLLNDNQTESGAVWIPGDLVVTDVDSELLRETTGCIVAWKYNAPLPVRTDPQEPNENSSQVRPYHLYPGMMEELPLEEQQQHLQGILSGISEEILEDVYRMFRDMGARRGCLERRTDSLNRAGVQITGPNKESSIEFFHWTTRQIAREKQRQQEADPATTGGRCRLASLIDIPYEHATDRSTVPHWATRVTDLLEIPSANTVWSSHSNGEIRVWQRDTGALLKTLRGAALDSVPATPYDQCAVCGFQFGPLFLGKKWVGERKNGRIFVVCNLCYSRDLLPADIDTPATGASASSSVSTGGDNEGGSGSKLEQVQPPYDLTEVLDRHAVVRLQPASTAAGGDFDAVWSCTAAGVFRLWAANDGTLLREFSLAKDPSRRLGARRRHMLTTAPYDWLTVKAFYVAPNHKQVWLCRSSSNRRKPPQLIDLEGYLSKEKVDLPEAMVAQLRAEFGRMDVDGDGVVSQHDLRKSLAQKSSVPLSSMLKGEAEYRVAEELDKYDLNRDGKIDFDEFCEYHRRRYHSSLKKKHIKDLPLPPNYTHADVDMFLPVSVPHAKVGAGGVVEVTNKTNIWTVRTSIVVYDEAGNIADVTNNIASWWGNRGRMYYERSCIMAVLSNSGSDESASDKAVWVGTPEGEVLAVHPETGELQSALLRGDDEADADTDEPRPSEAAAAAPTAAQAEEEARFQRMRRHAAKYDLSEMELHELRMQFAEYDIDKDGVISTDDLTAFYRRGYTATALANPTTAAQITNNVHRFLEDYHRGREGDVPFDSFCEVYRVRMLEVAPMASASAADRPISALCRQQNILFVANIGQWLGRAAERPALRLWDVRTGALLAELTGRTYVVTRLLAVGTDRVWAACDDGALRIYEVLASAEGEDGAATSMANQKLDRMRIKLRQQKLHELIEQGAWGRPGELRGKVEAFLDQFAPDEVRELLNAREGDDRGTALHKAMAQQSGEVVMLFLARGANISLKNRYDQTALDYAGTPPEVMQPILAYLVEHKPDVRGQNGMNLLHYAAMYGAVDVVGRLLDRGLIDVNAPDHQGRTALHHAVIYGQLKVMSVLLASGANVGASDTISGNRPLHYAVVFSPSYSYSYGDTSPTEVAAMMCHMLIEARADVDAVNAEGLRPLHIAASDLSRSPNALDVVKLLVERGAAIDAVQQGGGSQTPLFFAATANNLAICKYLIDKGADPTMVCDGLTVLHVASQRREVEVLSFFIDLVPAEFLNRRSTLGDGATPLHLCAATMAVEHMSLLLRRGADPNVTNAAGDTPLHLVAVGSDDAVRCVQLLLSKGANPDIQNRKGETPLHIAVNNTSAAIVKLLCKRRARLDLADATGKTPLDWARCHGVRDIIEALELAAEAPPPSAAGAAMAAAIASGGCWREVQAHFGPVMGFVSTADVVWTAAKDGTLVAWSAASAEPLAEFDGQQNVYAMALVRYHEVAHDDAAADNTAASATAERPSVTTLWTADHEGQGCIFRITSGLPRPTCTLQHRMQFSGGVNVISQVVERGGVVWVGFNQTSEAGLNVYKAESGDWVRALDGGGFHGGGGYREAVNGLVAVTSPEYSIIDGRLKRFVWAARALELSRFSEDGRSSSTVERFQSYANGRFPNVRSLLAVGSRVWVGTHGGEIRVYDSATGQLAKELRRKSRGIGLSLALDDSLSGSGLEGAADGDGDGDSGGADEELPEEELDVVRRQFETFDSDGSGVLTRQKLREVVGRQYSIYGESASTRARVEREVETLMQTYDPTGSGSITFEDFVAQHRREKRRRGGQHGYRRQREDDPAGTYDAADGPIISMTVVGRQVWAASNDYNDPWLPEIGYYGNRARVRDRGSVHIWDAESGAYIRKLDGDHEGVCRVDAVGGRVWVSYASGVIRVYSADDAGPPLPSLEELYVDRLKLLVGAEADFSAALGNPDLSDITLRVRTRTGETKEVPAHKLILGSRSEVFYRMFTGGFKESGQKIVDIGDDVDFDVFMKMLRYMYSGGRVDITGEDALGLFIAADRYGLRKLRKQCELVLADIIDVDNVAEALQAAHDYGASYLESLCLHFIRKHRDLVTATEGWKELSKELVDQITRG